MIGTAWLIHTFDQSDFWLGWTFLRNAELQSFTGPYCEPNTLVPRLLKALWIFLLAFSFRRRSMGALQLKNNNRLKSICEITRMGYERTNLSVEHHRIWYQRSNRFHLPRNTWLDHWSRTITWGYKLNPFFFNIASDHSFYVTQETIPKSSPVWLGESLFQSSWTSLCLMNVNVLHIFRDVKPRNDFNFFTFQLGTHLTAVNSSWHQSPLGMSSRYHVESELFHNKIDAVSSWKKNSTNKGRIY
jgi:hypothetical protein